MALNMSLGDRSYPKSFCPSIFILMQETGLSEFWKAGSQAMHFI